MEGIRAQQHTIELDPGYLPQVLGRLLRFTQQAGILLQTIPEQAPDMLFAGRILEGQELWPQAKILYQRAIDLAPDDGKPLYYREYAEALARRGEDAEARDILRVVLRFDPQNLDLQLALAASLHRLKQEGEALQVYHGAMELATAMQRESRTAPAQKSRRPAAPDRIPREQRVIEAIRKRFPVPKRTAEPVTMALGGLAAFYHDQGRDDLAVPLWEKAIGASPDDAATAFGLARSYDAVGAWVSAIDQYKRAIELNKGNLEYRLTLAERYYENDMTFQAINLWREVVAVRPTLAAARLKLAGAYLRLEQYPDAQREYERVLQLDPANLIARDGLMRIQGRAIAPPAPRR
jgi:superkiller protein 3